MSLLGVLLLALLLQSAGPQRTPDNPASVEGVVVKAGTNQPIAGATVELTGIAPRTVEGGSTFARGVISVSVQESASDGRVFSFSTMTRADGRFEIDNIPAGTEYHLVAIHSPDYLPAQYGQRVPAVPGRSITLTGGQQFKNARIEMTPTGSVSGQIVDSSGQPMRNVMVELRRPWYLEGWRLLADWNQVISRVRGIGKTNRAGATTTNARGEFSFSGLPPAQYYVRTNVSTDDAAVPVNLHAGASITNVKIIVPETRPMTIQGTVFMSGANVRSAQVGVFPENVVPLYEDNEMDVGSARNGAFALTVPHPGNYVVVAVASGQSALLRASKKIEVRNADVPDLRLELVPAFSISGRVTFEGSAPTTSSAIPFTLYPMDAIAQSVTSLMPAGNGSFTLRGVTVGDYRVEVGAAAVPSYSPNLITPANGVLNPGTERAYVKSVRLDGKDILNAGVHLESATTGLLEVVISMNGGTLAGRVVDSNGKPVANAKTVLVPDSARRQRGDLYKYVSTDDLGGFQLNGISPGDYKLFAWERVEEGAWQDPQFLRLFESAGSPVRVAEGARVTADAKLILAWN